jgi:hypothetical protein
VVFRSNGKLFLAGRKKKVEPLFSAVITCNKIGQFSWKCV